MPVRVGLLGWFVYPLTLTLTASNQQIAEGIIPIVQNTDFDLQAVQFWDPLAAPANTGNVSIKFGTSNVFFMQDFIMLPNICGDGQLPNWLPAPYVTFPRGSVIQVQIRNEAAASHTIYLAFEGVNKPPND